MTTAPVGARRRLGALLVAALVAALGLAATAPPARAATPSADEELPAELRQRLTAAESAFRVQNYPRVIELLQPLVGHRLLRGRDEHRDVLEWLGVSQYLSGARDAARLVFTKLVQEWPRYHLDELLYPPDLVRFYEERRQDLIDLGVIEPGRDPNVKTRLVLVRELETSDVPTIAYFAPFGVGQFANDEPGKGTAIAVIQGIGLVTTAVTWFAIDGLKDSETGYVARADESKATAFNALWIAGAVLFGGSYVYSVADGLLGRRTEGRATYRYELIDVDELPPAPDLSGLRLGPSREGYGVELSLGF